MEDEIETINMKKILPALTVSVFLIFGIYIAYLFARPRSGSIVLPGGITYLGPSPTATAVNVNTPTKQQLATGKIPIPENTTWVENKGKLYPFSFLYPSSLSLGVFPNDPYDGVTVFYANTNPQSNLFFRVEDLNKLDKKEYIGKPLEYAQIWWKEYSWKGVGSVTAFTSPTGLKGYRAKYLDESNNTPYDHVFFEVPQKPNLVIWISGKLFTQADFDRLVQSVTWK